MKTRKLLAIVLALAMVLTFSITASAQAPYMAAPKYDNLNYFDKTILDLVDMDLVEDALLYITKEIGVRVAGTPSDKLAADYLENVYKDLGLDTYQQPIALSGNTTIGKLNVHGAENWYGKGNWDFGEWQGTRWECGGAANGVITGDATMVTGKVVDCGMATPAEIIAAGANDGLKGNIVLYTTGQAVNTVIANAKAQGAVGVMVHSLRGSRDNFGSASSPSVTAGTDIPVLGLALCQAEWLREMLAEFGTVTADIQTYSLPRTTARNVIAKKNGTVPNAPIIMAGGHHDTVIGSPGANDSLASVLNGVNVAQVFAQVSTDHVDCYFGSWTNEEGGSTGSAYFVNRTNLAANIAAGSMTAAERDRMIGYWHCDMPASAQDDRTPYLFLQRYNANAPRLVVDYMYAAADRLGYRDLVRDNVFQSSDHGSFYNAGIPTAMFIRMGGVGSTSNYSIEQKYHTPQDCYEDNISMKNWQLVAELMAVSMYDAIRTFKVNTRLTAPEVTLLDSDAEFNLSVYEVEDMLTAEIEFEFDGDLLAFIGVEGLNGFEQIGDITWRYAGGNTWKGTVTIGYPDGGTVTGTGFSTLVATDIAKFVFAPRAEGDATVKITNMKVAGVDFDLNQVVEKDVMFLADEATTTLLPNFSKYDLNRDGIVDALDLGIMLLYCGFDSDSPNWGTLVKVNDSRGKGVTASMCDVNNDGVIDMLDLLDLFLHYTK
ncbi:MAG: M28 family peptidase [Clostridiales bacterium]|nr:M28 family peptidase [Clostridiales bacterium]